MLRVYCLTLVLLCALGMVASLPVLADVPQPATPSSTPYPAPTGNPPGYPGPATPTPEPTEFRLLMPLLLKSGTATWIFTEHLPLIWRGSSDLRR
jgi:hypothetical protein